MDKAEYGVHRTHCCVEHGCKYGDKDCPVVSGEIVQDYLCEDCSYEGYNSVKELLEQSSHIYKIRILKEIRNYETKLEELNNETFNGNCVWKEDYEGWKLRKEKVESILEVLNGLLG